MENLFADTRKYLSRRSKPFLIMSGSTLVLLVGVADYMTGAELKHLHILSVSSLPDGLVCEQEGGSFVISY